VATIRLKSSRVSPGKALCRTASATSRLRGGDVAARR
jgi:hypothetical protein